MTFFHFRVNDHENASIYNRLTCIFGASMYKVFTCLTVEHDLRLVLLAGAVCFLASLAGINLFQRARAAGGQSWPLWIVAAGASTGMGVWATHFIAMLAYDPGVTVTYQVALTVTSLIIAAVLTGAGFALPLVTQPRWGTLVGGVVIGGGVALMHYLGMMAVEIPGWIDWDRGLVATSVVFGMAFAVAALSVATRSDRPRPTLVAASLLTSGIVALHFTAMGAVEITPDPTRSLTPNSVSPVWLAIAVAVSAAGVLGMSLAGAIASRRLHEKEHQLATAVNNMPLGLVMYDDNERLVTCNDRYLEMYDLSPDLVRPGCRLVDVIGARIASGSLVGDATRYHADITAAMRNGETRSWTVNGIGGRVIHTINRPIGNGAWVGTHEDITERKKAEDLIAHLARHDGLTGLKNRTSFTQYLEEALEQARSERGSFAIVCIDFDRFKEVNDVFGHPVGDALLKLVSERLQEAVGDAFLARLGGDEFAAVLIDGEQPATAEAVSQRLLACVDRDIEVEGHHLRIGLSLGVAIYPADGENANTLLANADAALYRAKQDGRGTMRFFQSNMDERLRERRAMQHDLRTALARDQLFLHFQPQARVDGEISGFEALVRWHHPTRGVVPPGTFIPIAEESGLIMQIGEWVLREACREAASWENPLSVAINLSPIQFRHGDLPGLVHSALLEAGLAPSRLEIEITESVLIGDYTRAVSMLRRIKALGARIAMDDFGTGYSSLSYLQSFPFDKIKIDQAFIANLFNGGQSAAIIRAVIGLGRGLDLPVVAEGVETREQLDFLARESCEGVQGFLVGRPGPIDDYAEVIGRMRTKMALSRSAT
jgi:diguanylate cyclase (GGDEF)-like protein